MSLVVKGILSYPHLFVPRAVNPGDDPKFGVTILIRKDDPQIAEIQKQIEAMKANAWPSGFPHNGKVCLHDCAVSQPGNAALANFMELRAGAKMDQKPAVVDMNRQPIIDPSQAFAGAEAFVAVNLFTYNQAVNKGVSAGLNGVMLTGNEGELGRLDGRPTVDQMFSTVNETPAAAPAAPAARQMTPKAAGATYESFIAQGWTDEALIQNGYMLPPGGVPTSF